MIRVEGVPLAGGVHTVSATAKKLDENADGVGFRMLTIRLTSGATTDITFGNSAGQFMFLQADESWTFGPNAGTIRPEDIYIVGTAADTVDWCGILV
jgi:hypothetical protein